jgi:L-ascorbate metabolism protein UlaG (beta-lactamase superfamily)/ketosteroid isomerase-like protein
VPWLEPYPDKWLTSGTGPSPEARYEQRESVELAFVVALQELPPLQRAVLLLREVVGLSAAEIAGQLSTSTASVTSALQRARVTVRDRLQDSSQQSVLRLLGDERITDIVRQYTNALERGDADMLIRMLTEDASWSMPPIPTWFRGHQDIREWLARDPLTMRWKHLPTRANGQLAVGCYILDEASGEYVAHAIDVLTLRGAKISAVTAFLVAEALDPVAASGLPSGAEFFSTFGLPPRWPERLPRVRTGNTEQMDLVRLPHACVRLETSEGVLVIDPGVFSGPDKLTDADVVLITHLHPDHLDTAAITTLAAARPDLQIYGPPSLATELGDTPFTAVRDGDTIEAAGITATVHGKMHARIVAAMPPVENVGYYIEGVYHPGDSFTIPSAPVRILLAPIGAPWLKLSEAADFIDAVSPATVHPIHDAVLSEVGQTLSDRILSGVTKPDYVRLAPGERVTLQPLK